tara:strand:- start:367 stop:1029 length:663 start_codon:yes stop_codon:yes gene_type:complete
MSFLVIIPARGNSVRIKEKNIRFIKNKPLIYYTINEAKKSKYLKKVFVSTDNLNIKKISKRYGALVPFMRKKSLAKKNSLMHSVVKDFIKMIKKKTKIKYKYIILLQPTSPLRKYTDINKACKLILENPSANCLVSTCSFKKGDSIKKKMYTDNKYLSYRKNKIYNHTCLRNGPAILITKIENISKFLIGGKILNLEMPVNRSLDINEFKDLNKMSKLIK